MIKKNIFYIKENIYLINFNLYIKMKDLDITIDDNNNIRVLPIEKYTASQKLKGESNKFVSSK